ncbi:hypothetical protein SCALM49S_07228 [Streptomyces californicus]
MWRSPHFVTNEVTGKRVVLSEPAKWGQRLTLFDFDLVWERGRWAVEKAGSRVLNSNTVPEDPKVTSLLRREHREVVEYVNQVIGTSVVAMSTADAPWRDEPIIDLINQVQTETVRAGLAGGEFAGVAGVVAGGSCFSRTAGIPAGDVMIRDAAGLYPFENTLEARLITGAQVKDYLEYSARYYVRTPAGGPVDTAKLTNADGIRLQLRRGVGCDV